MSCKCTICNRGNNPRLALNPEDFYQGTYLDDERYPGEKICDECFEIIGETLFEMEKEDEQSND